MLLLLPILDFQIFFGLFSRTGSLCTNLFTAFIIMCFLSSIFMRPKKYHNAMKLQHDPLVTLHKTWYTFTHIAQSQTYKHHLGKFSFLCKLSSQIIFTIKALNQISGYLFARIVSFVWCQWIVGSAKDIVKISEVPVTSNYKNANWYSLIAIDAYFTGINHFTLFSFFKNGHLTDGSYRCWDVVSSADNRLKKSKEGVGSLIFRSCGNDTRWHDVKSIYLRLRSMRSNDDRQKPTNSQKNLFYGIFRHACPL